MYLVAGSTGNVGREVVRALLGRGADVRALVRDHDSSPPAGATPVTGDLDDPSSMSDVFRHIHGVFLLPGYRDMPGLIAAARSARVARIVQLSGRSAANGDMTNAISAYMIRSEQAVKDGGIPWTIVRPSAFDSNALRWRRQLQVGDVVRAPFENVQVASIDPYDIGEVVAKVLTTDGHEGHTYEISGPQPLRPADQVRILGKALGRDLRFEAQPNDEAREEMLAAMPAKYVDAMFRFYVDGTLDESAVLSTVREITRREPRTFEQWAADHVRAF